MFLMPAPIYTGMVCRTRCQNHVAFVDDSRTICEARYHRLNGSSSRVLTATPHSYGKGQNSTPYKIKTPERIGIRFGTVDYVLDISPQNKFGDDRSSGKYVKYTMFVTFFIFFPEWTGRSHPSTNFHAEYCKRRGSTYRCAFCSKNRNFF